MILFKSRAGERRGARSAGPDRRRPVSPTTLPILLDYALISLNKITTQMT